MKLQIPFFIAVLLFPFLSSSQSSDTLIKKLDSLGNKAGTVKQKNNINRTNYNEITRITFGNYFVLLADDFKQQITGPFHTSKQDWIKVGGFALATGAVAFADEPIQRFALDLRTHNPDLQTVSKYVTNFGGLYEGYTLAALGAYGFIFKSEKIKTTTLLATQAYLTGGALESVLKLLSGRQRPSYYNPNAIEAEPTFKGPFAKLGTDMNGKRTNSSFPSGHTTVAFAAATVFAMEYRDRPLIPVLSYSAATLIGLSRITENKHWTTDVLVGAALGYLSGRQVVNNYHRYARLQNERKRKATLSFNLQYLNSQFVPGLVYRF